MLVLTKQPKPQNEIPRRFNPRTCASHGTRTHRSTHRPRNQMRTLPINSLPPLWWIRPWTTSTRLQSHLSAVNELLARNIDRAEEAQQQAEAIRLERDRAIINANKWRLKYEDEVARNVVSNRLLNDILDNTAMDESLDDFIGDSDYLR